MIGGELSEAHARIRGSRGLRSPRRPDRGSFPSEDSARKLLYLAITRAQRNWRHAYDWSSALVAFRIHFGDRVPDAV
ncbi:MAG: hypothetical protein ACLP8S_02490 [Solirubrobacteraceae bacterium]